MLKLIAIGMMLTSIVIVLMNGCSVNPSANNPADTLAEKTTAIRGEDGSYVLKLPALGEYKIFQGPSPSKINWEKFIETKENSLYFPPAPDKGRIFFAVESTKDTLIVSERQIPTDDQPNFRDLGGLPTKDGRYVKWGTIYRSGKLSDLKKAELTYFSKLGIRTIVDLRNNIEIAKDPDRYPKGVNYIQISLSDKEGKAYSRLKQMVLKEGYRRTKARDLFVDVMKSFADTLARDVKPVFDFMLSDKEDIPMLYHCTGGKDRTGYVTAMILLALDVDRKTIIDDYLMSNYYRRDSNLRSMKRARLIGLDAETLEYAILVRKEYMDAVFQVIDEKYGGNSAYLETKFGLTEAKRLELKKRYTVPYFNEKAKPLTPEEAAKN
jgi:protein-tyrosine phosphatase